MMHASNGVTRIRDISNAGRHPRPGALLAVAKAVLSAYARASGWTVLAAGNRTQVVVSDGLKHGRAVEILHSRLRACPS